MVLGFGNPIPPAGQPGPAAAVGQRPHMDYAGMVKQSMHELATWVTAGSKMAPQPVSLTVDGYRNVFEVGDKFNIEERYGYFDLENPVTAGHSPVKMVVEYDDGSKKRVQASDLTFAIDDGKGGYKPCELGGALGEQRRRTLIATYTDEDTGVSVKDTMRIVVTEHVAPEQTLRFKVGVEIPEDLRDTVIPAIEYNREVYSRSPMITPINYYSENAPLFTVDSDNIAHVRPIYGSFDSSGKLLKGWAVFYVSGDPTDLFSVSGQPASSVDGISEISLGRYITEIISDPDYAWLRSNMSNFRRNEFKGWINLQYGLIEEPTTLRSVYNYRTGQYAGCHKLVGFKDLQGKIVDQPEELGNVNWWDNGTAQGFRDSQFENCYSLTKPLVEHSPSYYTPYDSTRFLNFRTGQYFNCRSLTVAADEDPFKPGNATTVHYRADQYYGCRALTTSKPEHTHDQTGQVDANLVTRDATFRSRQYYGCSSLKANGIEKMIETLTGEPFISTTIRDDKYYGTQVTDAEPFYYQGNDSDEPVKALQRDVYTWHSADNKTTKYVRHYSIYGGTADTPNAITATTDSKWKSTYKENEVLQVDGLTVDIVNNDGTTRRYTPPFATNMFKFEPPVGTKVHADDDHVSITYATDGTSVTTSVPITVTAA